MSMRRVIVESPYAAATDQEREANVAYARAAVRDCILRGEAPLASHLLFTQPGILHDEIRAERSIGMQAGFTWTPYAEAVVVYTDRGVSAGMKSGIGRATGLGIPVEYRTLDHVLSPATLSRMLASVGVTAEPRELAKAARTDRDVREVIAWADSGAAPAAAPDWIKPFLANEKDLSP
jgi:hypothetical protein